MGKLKIAALISGGGSNLAAILDAVKSGFLNAEVVSVGSDNPHAKGLLRPREEGISTFVVNYKDIFKSFSDASKTPLPPEDFDAQKIHDKQRLFHGKEEKAGVLLKLTKRAVCEKALLDALNQNPFDLLVLAGFMRVLTPYFIDRVQPDKTRPKIMNIHPALLPAFPGVDGYGDTFFHGCKVGGCTVHFLDYGEDTGPIIGQKCFPIEPGDDVDAVKKKGLALEWRLFPECIRLFSLNRLEVVETAQTLKNGQTIPRRRVRILP